MKSVTVTGMSTKLEEMRIVWSEGGDDTFETSSLTLEERVFGTFGD
jgi:hypothetical protein